MLNQALQGIPGLLQPDTDWTYTKKRDAQEILPGLWLGPFGAARDQEFLQRAGITDALVVRAPEEARIIAPKYPELIRYEVLECRDSPFENIIRFFPGVKQLFDGVLGRGGRILVHGNAGMSRSAAFVVAYVMQRFELTSDLAHHYVLTRRHCISRAGASETRSESTRCCTGRSCSSAPAPPARRAPASRRARSAPSRPRRSPQSRPHRWRPERVRAECQLLSTAIQSRESSGHRY
ncbi:unnamed protein product [Prorocentrum cordatum]|uniref:Protein-serine/threonine phosphatase n=1 Tax=Prorocentrum cordatum TaxID=2364126 RepID=A0ABN9V217_9DINO|nr:unnamed protein product [Polarella glacialis]